MVLMADFRSTGSSAFQALKTFCDLINQTISDSLTEFYSNQYVGASVVPQQLFEAETNASIDQFRSSLISSFLLSLVMIQNTTLVNALFSALETNSMLGAGTNNRIFILSKDYSGCLCAFSSKCTMEADIGDISNRCFTVPGFYVGCYMIESLLQSTLECFYDQDCVDKLKKCYLPSPSMNVIALNASLSKYSENSTIQELVDNLMIEQWNVSLIFEHYYNECLPMQCTYTLETKNDVIYIFTTLFGIVGGLTTVLKLLIPRLGNIIVYCIRKQRTRIVPEISVVDI
jgi:hypothetical protein